MFRNLHLKFIALILAILFWVFVVSLENTFFQFPQEVNIKVFNQSQDLALASQLGTVKLTLRAEDANILRALSKNDFEAYVDLKDVGAGKAFVPVSVTSKNPQVSVVRTEPAKIEIELEPVREKNVTLLYEVSGKPADGFEVEESNIVEKGSAVPKYKTTIIGAQSVIAKVRSVVAKVSLKGTEKADVKKNIEEITVVDDDGNYLEGVEIKQKNLQVAFTIRETENPKKVGINPIFPSRLHLLIGKTEVEPAAVLIVAEKEVLSKIEVIETEEISFPEDVAAGIIEKKAKLVLPEGVKLAQGQSEEVSVKVEVIKSP